jgi:hypothetical protein
MMPLVVGGKTLKVPNGDGFALFGKDAPLLALAFLGADPAANGRQTVLPPNRTDRLGEFPFLDQLDEIRDSYGHRTSFHAGGFLALDASLRLFHGEFRCVPKRDLVKIAPANLRRLFGHGLPGYFFFFF